MKTETIIIACLWILVLLATAGLLRLDSPHKATMHALPFAIRSGR